MFALASDLLHDVRVEIQGPHLVIPDRCVQSRSARCRRVAVARGQRGWPFMADRTPPARPPQRPRLTSRPGTASWDCARARVFTRTTSGSRGSEARTSRQGRPRGTLGRWIRMRFTVCHLLGRSLRGRADGSLLVLGPVLRGTVRARARDRRHPKVPTWVEIFRGWPRYPKAPVRLADGVTGHPAGQESRSPSHRTARSVTVMCITAKPKGDKACMRT